MKFMGLGVLFLWVLVVAVDAQKAPPAYVVEGDCPENGLPHVQQWLEASGVAYGKPYIADEKRKSQIVEGYSKLRLNMSANEVEALMGRPDYSRPKIKGHLSNAPAPNPPVCNEQFVYMLKKENENLADMNDVGVYVFFTTDDKLYWATPLNLEDLKPIGSPIQ